MFDWEDMRHFAVLAQRGSLSAAARALHVEHATVARRVAALETALELKLVDRRPRSYALTADGERIAALAARMQDEAFAVDRTARARQSSLAGTVSISAPPTLASNFIAPRIAAIRERHPHIHVRLLGEKRYASLSRREADIAVRLDRPTERRVAARRIGRVVFALYGSRGYAARHAEKDYCFIAYDETQDHLPQQQWLRKVAGTRPIVLRTTELEAQCAAARAGVGIAALPHFLGEQDTQLARMDGAADPVTREVWLIVHRDLRRAPAVRAVMEFLTECFEAGLNGAASCERKSNRELKS